MRVSTITTTRVRSRAGKGSHEHLSTVLISCIDVRARQNRRLYTCRPNEADVQGAYQCQSHTVVRKLCPGDPSMQVMRRSLRKKLPKTLAGHRQKKNGAKSPRAVRQVGHLPLPLLLITRQSRPHLTDSSKVLKEALAKTRSREASSNRRAGQANKASKNALCGHSKTQTGATTHLPAVLPSL